MSTVSDLMSQIELFVQRKNPEIKLKVHNLFVEDVFSVDPMMTVGECFSDFCKVRTVASSIKQKNNKKRQPVPLYDPN